MEIVPLGRHHLLWRSNGLVPAVGWKKRRGAPCLLGMGPLVTLDMVRRYGASTCIDVLGSITVPLDTGSVAEKVMVIVASAE